MMYLEYMNLGPEKNAIAALSISPLLVHQIAPSQRLCAGIQNILTRRIKEGKINEIV